MLAQPVQPRERTEGEGFTGDIIEFALVTRPFRLQLAHFGAGPPVDIGNGPDLATVAVI